MDTITMVVSAGHNEYPIGCSEELWSSHNHDHLWLADDVEAAATELYKSLGLPEIDADVSWETIIRVTGQRETLNQALDMLLGDLCGGPKGGDDDTFDYWPSGMRLAQQVAAVLGRADEIDKRTEEWVEQSGYSRDELGC